MRRRDSTTEAGGETVIIGFGTLNASSATGLEGGTSTTDSLADFKITDPDASVPTVAITGIPDEDQDHHRADGDVHLLAKSVTGFVKNDITVSGGTAGTFGGNGTTYTLGITPTSGSNVVVTVTANSATDGTNTGPASAETCDRRVGRDGADGRDHRGTRQDQQPRCVHGDLHLLGDGDELRHGRCQRSRTATRARSQAAAGAIRWW